MSNYLTVQPMDIVNGLGTRFVIFMSGCSHQCKGCYNQVSWSPDKGFPIDDTLISNMVDALVNPNRPLAGLTLTGGDPLFPGNLETTLKLCQIAREKAPNKNIWIWTGYEITELFDQTSNHTAEQYELIKQILKLIDIIVDGKFNQDEADPGLAWRGSKNQHVICIDQQYTTAEPDGIVVTRYATAPEMSELDVQKFVSKFLHEKYKNVNSAEDNALNQVTSLQDSVLNTLKTELSVLIDARLELDLVQYHYDTSYYLLHGHIDDNLKIIVQDFLNNNCISKKFCEKINHVVKSISVHNNEFENFVNFEIDVEMVHINGLTYKFTTTEQMWTDTTRREISIEHKSIEKAMPDIMKAWESAIDWIYAKPNDPEDAIVLYSDSRIHVEVWYTKRENDQQQVEIDSYIVATSKLIPNKIVMTEYFPTVR